jgi:cbb3-type cytochrome oxidase subunit 3
MVELLSVLFGLLFICLVFLGVRYFLLQKEFCEDLAGFEK